MNLKIQDQQNNHEVDNQRTKIKDKEIRQQWRFGGQPTDFMAAAISFFASLKGFSCIPETSISGLERLQLTNKAQENCTSILTVRSAPNKKALIEINAPQSIWSCLSKGWNRFIDEIGREGWVIEQVRRGTAVEPMSAGWIIEVSDSFDKVVSTASRRIEGYSATLAYAKKSVIEPNNRVIYKLTWGNLGLFGEVEFFRHGNGNTELTFRYAKSKDKEFNKQRKNHLLDVEKALFYGMDEDGISLEYKGEEKVSNKNDPANLSDQSDSERNQLIHLGWGRWRANYQTLEAGLKTFSNRFQGHLYGDHNFQFIIHEINNLPESLSKSWRVVPTKYDDSHSNDEPMPSNADFNGPLPYAEIVAREVVGFIKVEIWHNGRFGTALFPYLDELLKALVEDGFEIASTENPYLKSFLDWIEGTSPFAEDENVDLAERRQSNSTETDNSEVVKETSRFANNDQIEMNFLEGKIKEIYDKYIDSSQIPTDEMIAIKLPNSRKGQPYTRETVNRYRNKMRKRGIDV